METQPGILLNTLIARLENTQGIICLAGFNISLCLAGNSIRNQNMKINKLKKRLNRNRPMTSVTIRMPEDIVEDLKRIAPVLGYSGYQPLIRAYVGQALRKDLERLEDDTVSAFVSGLKRRGVSNEIIKAALSEATRSESNHR